MNKYDVTGKYTDSIMPDQRVSFATKKKPEWYVPMTEYIINQALSNNDKEEIKKYVNAANGIIDEETFKYVLKPYGNSANNNLSNFKFPGAIRKISLITPIIEKLVGEFENSVHDFIVTVNNSDVIYERNEALAYEVSKLATQLLINYINNSGVETGVESNEVPDIKEFVDNYKKEYLDNISIEAQDRLEAIIDWTDSKLLYTKAYFWWIVTGEVYSYREIHRDNLYKFIVSPLEYYPVSNGKDFVEEHDMGLRIYSMSYNEIIDRFRDIITEKDLNYIRNEVNRNINNSGGIYVDLATIKSKHDGGYYATLLEERIGANQYMLCRNANSVDVYHVVFKSDTKIGILTYIDELGVEREKEVDETYKLDTNHGDVSIEWTWINKFYEVWRFGEKFSGVYTTIKPLDVQRNESNNTSKCKSCYNGKRHVIENIFNHAIPGRMLDFDVLYKVYNLQLERLVNKEINHGKITIVPKGLLTASDISEEENIYYMTADGMAYVDETRPNFANIVNGFKVIDSGLAQHIGELVRLISSVKQDAWDSIGWNRQRDGNIYASDGKATTERGYIQSATSTSFMNSIFDYFVEKDYQADLDYSKVAWINSNEGQVIGTFRTSQGDVKTLTIDPIKHLFSDYGVFVKKRDEETRKRDEAKHYGFAMAQNGDSEIAMEVIDANSFTKIKKSIKQYNESVKKYNEYIQEQETARAMEVQDREDMRHDKELQNNIDVALIKEGYGLQGKIIAANNTITPDNTESNNLKREQINQKEREGERKERINDKQIKSNERIAKMNKN